MSVSSDSCRHSFPSFGRGDGSAPAAAGGFRRYACVDGGVVPAEDDTDPRARLERMAADAERREREAQARGYAEGEAAGRRAGAEALTPVLERFRQSISQVEKFRRQIYHNAEQEAVALALALATKIVGYEVRANSEVVLHTVRRAMQKVVDHERIRIRLNPADLQTVQNHLVQFGSLTEDLEQVTFEADERITSGGCRVETNFGDIDARIESQLEAVERTLRLGLEQSPHRPAEPSGGGRTDSA